MKARRRPPLEKVVDTLLDAYGEPVSPAVTDPWEQIVAINASYLVDDDRRLAVLEALRRQVGLAPPDLLAAPQERLLAAIAGGGMKPEMRADKLLKAAKTAEALEAPLEEIVRFPLDRAAKALQRFPGVGPPVAERIALFAGAHAVLALESNGLRVLVRLGFGVEDERYERMWRQVREAVDQEAPRDVVWCQAAHALLRRHGQEICKHKAPRCVGCRLRRLCPHTGSG